MDDASSWIDVSRFTALARMDAHLEMQESECWERDEFPVLSSFLKGTSCPTKVLVLFIHLRYHAHTRQEAIKAFERIGQLVSEGCTGE